MDDEVGAGANGGEKADEQGESHKKYFWMRGPFKFEGSTRFYNVYREGRFKTFIGIYYLPDSSERTLLNDY